MENKIKPLDAFTTLFRVLTLTAYYMAVPEPQTKRKRTLHYIYRVITVIILLIYDLQHIIFVVKVFGDMDSMMEGLSILFTALNVTYKLLTVNLNCDRISRLHDMLNDKMFSASCSKDEEYMKANKEQLNSLSRTINRTVSVIGLFWLLTPFIGRFTNVNVILPAYFPFSTDNWIGFSCASIWLTFVIIWIGYGHMTLNILITGYYSQAKVQLSIIRFHLEHLADDDPYVTDIADANAGINVNDAFIYKDYRSNKYQKRLVNLIQRYEKVTWFSKELESIMSKAMLVQFVGSTAIVCSVVFKMTGLPFNTSFIYVLLYLGCLLLELYMYCYYGTLLKHESDFINQSIYLSDWVSLSPKFRRQLLIAMARWSQPITPQAAGLVPIELGTFIVVLRGSYTLYTILKQS